MKRLFATLIVFCAAVPTLALGQTANLRGNAAAGAAEFERQCTSCHLIQGADGQVLAGRTAQTGPNLYGLVGRAVGRVDSYRYSGAIIEAGAAGAVWTENDFVGYLLDPNGWLAETLDDSGARGRMVYQVRDRTEALNIYAYIASLGGGR
ncbi:MAG: cytochrome C [Pseudomonadota bacterium]